VAKIPSDRFNSNPGSKHAPGYSLRIFSKKTPFLDFFTSSEDTIFGSAGQNEILESIRQKITTVEYEDNEILYDQLKITFRGSLLDSTGVQVPVPEFIMREDLFEEGTIISLKGGYGTSFNSIGAAEVIKREFNYSDDPSCTVIAYEPLHRMAQESEENLRIYTGLRAAQIVQNIGRRAAYNGPFGALFTVHKINPLLPIFTRRAERQKAGESDYQFVDRMARVRGWDFFTRFDDKTNKFDLQFGPNLDDKDAKYRYEYGSLGEYRPLVFQEDRLLNFTPMINVIDQNTSINIVSMNPKEKKKIESGNVFNEKTGAFDNAEDLAEKKRDPSKYRADLFGESKVIVANKPFKNEAEVKKFVVRWAREKIKNFITGSGRVMGNEFLQTRTNQEFGGLGISFSGTFTNPATWYLTKVKHIFSSSSGLTYETSFDARRAIDWIPGDIFGSELIVNLHEAEKKKKTTQFNIITASFEEL